MTAARTSDDAGLSQNASSLYQKSDDVIESLKKEAHKATIMCDEPATQNICKCETNEKDNRKLDDYVMQKLADIEKGAKWQRNFTSSPAIRQETK